MSDTSKVAEWERGWTATPAGTRPKTARQTEADIAAVLAAVRKDIERDRQNVEKVNH